jgi:hypothetical protein
MIIMGMTTGMGIMGMATMGIATDIVIMATITTLLLATMAWPSRWRLRSTAGS